MLLAKTDLSCSNLGFLSIKLAPFGNLWDAAEEVLHRLNQERSSLVRLQALSNSSRADNFWTLLIVDCYTRQYLHYLKGEKENPNQQREFDGHRITTKRRRRRRRIRWRMTTIVCCLLILSRTELDSSADPRRPARGASHNKWPAFVT